MSPDSVMKSFEGLTLAVLGVILVVALVARAPETAQVLRGLGAFYTGLVSAFVPRG